MRQYMRLFKAPQETSSKFWTPTFQTTTIYFEKAKLRTGSTNPTEHKNIFNLHQLLLLLLLCKWTNGVSVSVYVSISVHIIRWLLFARAPIQRVEWSPCERIQFILMLLNYKMWFSLSEVFVFVPVLLPGSNLTVHPRWWWYFKVFAFYLRCVHIQRFRALQYFEIFFFFFWFSYCYPIENVF